MRKYAREWIKDRPNYYYKIAYGLDSEALSKFFHDRNSSCEICEKPVQLDTAGKNDSAHIDHDHSTGKVRGLLCQSCNTSIGKLGDTPESLLKAYNYLKRTTL